MAKWRSLGLPIGLAWLYVATVTGANRREQVRFRNGHLQRSNGRMKKISDSYHFAMCHSAILTDSKIGFPVHADSLEDDRLCHVVDMPERSSQEGRDEHGMVLSPKPKDQHRTPLGLFVLALPRTRKRVPPEKSKSPAW